MFLGGFWQVYEEFAHLAAEETAQQVNRRQIDSRGRLFVERRDRAAIEPSLSHDIRDAELVSPHQNGQIAADHRIILAWGDAQNNKMYFSA